MQAQRQAPDALPVYFSMYKYYFYKGNLEQAELAELDPGDSVGAPVIRSIAEGAA